MINSKIKQKATVWKKDECLDLPPKIYKTRFLTMVNDQQKAYNEMKKDFITYIQDNPDLASVASTAMTKLIRLNQISSGFLKTDVMKTELNFTKNPKIEAIKEDVDALAEEHKIIIWALFRNNIFALVKELKKYNPAVIFGDSDGDANATKFNTDPSCRVCIAQPQSGSEAINLIEADYALYMSQDFSLKHRLQSEDRCHRSGSQKHDKITYIDYIFPGTTDEVIREAISNKIQLSKEILEKAKTIMEGGE